MNYSLLTSLLVCWLGSLASGQSGAPTEKQVGGKWDPDRMSIQWGVPYLVHETVPRRETLSHHLLLPGQIFYDERGEGRRPNWEECDLQVWIGRRPGAHSEWPGTVRREDSFWWPLKPTAWIENNDLVLFLDEDPPTIDDRGRFLALLPPAALRRVVGGTGMHQVAGVFFPAHLPGLGHRPANGAFIKSSMNMVALAGPDPLPPMQSIINGSPSPCTTCFEPVGLIRAVNRLQALGFDEAVHELRSYLMRSNGLSSTRLCGPDPTNPDTADEYRFFLILRLLFVRKEGAPFFVPDHGKPRPIPAMRSGLMNMHASRAYPDERYPLIVIRDTPFFMPEWAPVRSGSDPAPLPHLEWAAKHCKLREDPLRPPDDPFQALEELEKLGPALFEGNDPRRQLWHSLETVTGLPVPVPVTTFGGGASKIRRRIPDVDWERLRKIAAGLSLYWDEESQSYRGRGGD